MDLLCFILKQNEARAESTRKGVNQRSKHVTQTQRQRPESPMVTLTLDARKHKAQGNPLWSLCTSCLHAFQVRVTVNDSGLCCCVTSFER